MSGPAGNAAPEKRAGHGVPGRAEIVRCAAVAMIVVLLPLLGSHTGGAFGFPASSFWMLIVGPVVLIALARVGAAENDARDGNGDGNGDGDR